MASTIRISIAVNKYPWANFVTDLFDVLLVLYRQSLTFSRFVAFTAKKFLFAVFIAEIVAVVIIFSVIGIIVGLGSLSK